MARTIEKSINISASPEAVWSVVSDFASYPSWNPLITSIKGELKAGERFEVTIALPGVKPMTGRLRLLEAVPKRKARWGARLGIPGLFDAEHSMEIVSGESGGVRFIQHGRWSGILVPLVGKRLKKIEVGFEEMNKALKARTEGKAP